MTVEARTASPTRTCCRLAAVIAAIAIAVLGARAIASGRGAELMSQLAFARLPSPERQLVEFLLLMPLAALLISFFRVVIGLPSFGIFAPALVGLVFRERESLPGLAVFLALVFAGWFLRRRLERLHMLQAPRAAVVLSAVTLLLAIFVAIACRWELPVTRYVSLFPVIILTGIIERFWQMESDAGLMGSFRTLLSTLVIAMAVALVTGIEWISSVLMTHPEALGLIVAAQLLLGRYTGYRVSELWRFRALASTPDDPATDGLRWRLHERGILGMNRRNADFVLENTTQVVDDKLRLHRLCAAAGIPTPRIHAVVEQFREFDDAVKSIADLPGFVLKPARGWAGRGVRVVDRSGTENPDLAGHVADILAGLYSLGGQADVALFQERVRLHPAFEPIAVGGIPDLRIIVYRGVPAMAMLRLPTSQSRGRANLHQGGLGVGIDLADGTTCHAVLGDASIRTHPDTSELLLGRRIPEWGSIVGLAQRTAALVQLRFVGVDIVLDPERGPLVLEANARPGLAIQHANAAGLAARLDRIDRGDRNRCDVCTSDLARVA